MDRASLFGTDPGFGRFVTGPLLNWVGGLCAAALAVLALAPLRAIEAVPSLCPFRRFFGIDCYGCGMTRALCALLHGQVDAALHYNRGVMLVAPVLILLALVFVARFAAARARQPAGEFRLALSISWLIATVFTMSSAIAPYIFTEAQIARITPQCESKAKLGRPCFFCGMTTAFIDIAHGRLREAERANRGSLPLYAGFVCNGLLAAGFVLRAPRRC